MPKSDWDPYLKYVSSGNSREDLQARIQKAKSADKNADVLNLQVAMQSALSRAGYDNIKAKATELQQASKGTSVESQYGLPMSYMKQIGTGPATQMSQKVQNRVANYQQYRSVQNGNPLDKIMYLQNQMDRAVATSGENAPPGGIYEANLPQLYAALQESGTAGKALNLIAGMATPTNVALGKVLSPIEELIAAKLTGPAADALVGASARAQSGGGMLASQATAQSRALLAASQGVRAAGHGVVPVAFAAPMAVDAVKAAKDGRWDDAAAYGIAAGAPFLVRPFLKGAATLGGLNPPTDIRPYQQYARDVLSGRKMEYVTPSLDHAAIDAAVRREPDTVLTRVASGDPNDLQTVVAKAEIQRRRQANVPVVLGASPIDEPTGNPQRVQPETPSTPAPVAPAPTGEGQAPPSGRLRGPDGRYVKAQEQGPIQTRQDLSQAFQTQFGLPQDQAESASHVAEAHAQAWSKVTGRPVQDWYQSRIAGVEKGGEPGSGALYQDTPTFYSQAEKVVNEKIRQTVSSEDARNTLLKNGVTNDEMKWSGLDDLLDRGGKVTKQQLLDHLAENNVQVEEVVKGKTPRMSDADDRRQYELTRLSQERYLTPDERAEYKALNEKYSTRSQAEHTDPSLQLPGGSNYRELLLTTEGKNRQLMAEHDAIMNDVLRRAQDDPELSALKQKSDDAATALKDHIANTPRQTQIARLDALRAEVNRSTNEYQDALGKKFEKEYDRRAELRKQRSATTYTEGHYSEPNVLAHVRFNERTGPNGEKILHVEEVQSDWHQAGREKGYVNLEKPFEVFDAKTGDVVANYKTQAEAEAHVSREDYRKYPPGAAKHVMGLDWEDQREPADLSYKKVPPGPFSKTWHELAAKRIVKWAAEHGYDKVTWTTGDQQISRYTDYLRQHADQIGWKKVGSSVNVTASKDGKAVFAHPIMLEGTTSINGKRVTLEQVIGKEMASQIRSSSERSGEFRGQNLAIGGEGMRDFYDEKLLNTFDKLGKKFGSRVGTTEIQTVKPNEELPFITERGTPKWAGPEGVKESVHSLAITDSMRKSALSEGFPMFQGQKGATEFLKDGRAIIRALKNPDVSTVVHELAHVFRRDIESGDLAHVEQWAGVKDGKWEVAHEEKFARGFEKYLREGKAPTETLRRVFEQFKEWLTQIYTKLKGSPIDIKLTPEVREVFDRMLGKESTEPTPATPVKAPEVDVRDAIEYGKSNKIVTQDRYEELKKRISQQKLSSGVDPEMLKDLVEMGIYHIEAGTRSLAQWMKRMQSDTGADDDTLKKVWAQTKKDERLKAPVEPVKAPETVEAKVPEKATQKPAETPPPPKEPGKPTGSGEPSGKESGINQRTNEARDRGIEPGNVKGPEQVLAEGRTWLRKGGDPNALLDKLTAVHSTPSEENFGRLRAHQEVLDRATNRAGDEFGMESEQYKTAKAAEDAFAQRYKELSTRASGSLLAHKGGSDLDTGSFTSLVKAKERTTGKPSSPSEQREARKFIQDVKVADSDIAAMNEKVMTALSEGKMESPPSRMPSDTRGLREYFTKKFAGIFKVQRPPGGGESGAIRIPQGHKVFTTAEIRTIWDYAKKNYIGLGNVEEGKMWTLDEMTRDISEKLNIGEPVKDRDGNPTGEVNLKPEWVKSAFTQNKTVRRYVPETLKRDYDRRQTIKEARLWATDANRGPVLRALNTIWTFPMSEAIFGHGGVGMITHAGANIARPSGWVPYWRNFARQYPLVFNKAYHESLMQQMEMKPNHGFKLSVGLAIDPNKLYDNYQMYGRLLGGLGRSGNRGMDALKLFRDELFDLEWSRLDKSLQTPQMGKELANWINHVSGKGEMGQLTNIVGNKMFAPSLEAARWARTVGDPIKTARTLINHVRGENVSPEELYIAQHRVKRAVELLGTYTAMLAANNALLSTTGQKERVNFTDPTSTDWMKFKWAGRTLDPTGGSAGPLKFLYTVAQIFISSNPKTYGEKDLGSAAMKEIGYYARGKLAPQLGIAADIATHETMDRRPLTFRTSKEERVKNFPYGEPIGPLEYGLRHIPIPLAGGVEEYYDAFRKQGVPKSTAKAVLNGIVVGATELTGMRVGHEPKEFAKIPETATPKERETYNAIPDPVQKKKYLDFLNKESEYKGPLRFRKQEIKYDQRIKTH